MTDDLGGMEPDVLRAYFNIAKAPIEIRRQLSCFERVLARVQSGLPTVASSKVVCMDLGRLIAIGKP